MAVQISRVGIIEMRGFQAVLLEWRDISSRWCNMIANDFLSLHYGIQRQRIESERARERILERYNLHSRKEEKRTEEMYSEERIFEKPKPVVKVCMKTKELEFGGKIGMIVLAYCSIHIVFCKFPNSLQWREAALYAHHCIYRAGISIRSQFETSPGSSSLNPSILNKQLHNDSSFHEFYCIIFSQ